MVSSSDNSASISMNEVWGESFRNALEKNPDAVQIIRRGVVRLIEEIGDLKQAVQNNDESEIRKLLHSIKAFPVGLGLKSVYDHLISLEAMIATKNEQKETVMVHFDELNRLLQLALNQEFLMMSEEPVTPAPDEKNDELLEGKVRILVAEDNEMNQEMLAYILDGLEYEYKIVNNGIEVLDSLNKDAYDLLLLDMQMPVMGGIETARCIRAEEEWRKLPIIAVTAQDIEGDKSRYFKAGCNDFVAKPIDVNELALKINHLIC
jgi:two-component system, NarL family, sensor histidine kinase BarA